MKATSKMYISYTKEPKEFAQIHFLVFQGMFFFIPLVAGIGDHHHGTGSSWSRISIDLRKVHASC